MAVITLSRQYGSGGDEIAVQLCELLGYHSFDKRSIAQVATEMGLTDQDVVDLSEDQHQLRGFLDRILNRSRPVSEVRTWKEDTQGVRTVETAVLDEDTAISLVRSAILAAHQEDNIVIVGRGGQVVLKGKPGVLHVRIVAPLEQRIVRVQDQVHTDWVGAEALVNSRDATSADYMQRFYEVDWTDSTLYHLVINTGLWSLATAAHVIAAAIAYVEPVEKPE